MASNLSKNDIKQFIEMFYAIEVDHNSTEIIDPRLENELDAIMQDQHKIKILTDSRNVEHQTRDLIFRMKQLIEQVSIKSLKVSPNQQQFLMRLVQGTDVILQTLKIVTSHSLTKAIYQKVIDINVFADVNSNSLSKILQQNSSDSTADANSWLARTEDISTETFESIKGIDDILQKIIGIVGTSRTAFKSSGAKSFVLTGPPGTGKSSIAKACAAAHSNGRFYGLGVGELSEKYIGEAEKGVKALFRKFRESKENITIIFDEFDVLVTSQQAHLATIKTVIQTEISGGTALGPNFLLIAITNYYNLIPAVFRRRFAQGYIIPPPPREQIFNFFNSLLKSKIPDSNIEPNKIFTDVVISYINNPEKFYTNANIVKVIESIDDVVAGRKPEYLYYRVYNGINMSDSDGFDNLPGVRYNPDPNIVITVALPTIIELREAFDSIAVMGKREYEEYERNNIINSNY